MTYYQPSIGIEEMDRSCRLALAVLDGNEAMYDDVLKQGYAVDEYPLIWTLVRNWVQALVINHGDATEARRAVERTMFGHIEMRLDL